MPSYNNIIANTSQSTVVSDRTAIPYSSIATIDGIPHVHQLEIERIFTHDLNGTSNIVTQFLADPNEGIEVKRSLFIIPSSYITFNETTKTLSIPDLSVTTYNYVTPNATYTIPVPPIGSARVTVRRKTISNIPLVSWSPGTKLTSSQLNLMSTQLLYVSQEVLDRVYYQSLLTSDSISRLNSNSVSEDTLTANSVSTSKIVNNAITNDKIALGTITYDRTDQVNPWAVALHNEQTITGVKTFNNGIVIGSGLKYTSGVPSINGHQQILTLSASDGSVSWAQNNPWSSIPDNILTLDTEQTVVANKTFSGSSHITFSGLVSLNGTTSQSSGGNLTLGGTSIMSGSLALNGTTTIGSGGSLSSGGAITSNGSLVINGTTSTGSGCSLTIGGSTTVSGPLVVSGNTNINGNLGLNGSTITTSGSTLTLNGSTTSYGSMLLSGNTTIGGKLQITGSSSVNERVLTCTGSDSTIAWTPVVNRIRLGATGDISTGEVVITPESIGALSVDGGIVEGSVFFNNNVNLGDASLDDITIRGTLIYAPTEEGSHPSGRMLVTYGSAGEIGFQQVAKTITGLVMGGTTENANDTVITITPEKIGALSTTLNAIQTVVGAVSLDNNLTVGTNALNTLIIKSTLKYLPTVTATEQSGKVLTSDPVGNVSWAEVPDTGITHIQLGSNVVTTGPSVHITPESIGSPTTTTNETISGIKTFSNGLISTGTFKYIDGSQANSRVLTSDASGNASWQAAQALGITSIIMDGVQETASSVTITPLKIKALSTVSTIPQTVAGAVTLSAPLTISSTVSIGDKLKYLPTVTTDGLQTGKVLTSNSIGEVQWSPVPATGIVGITLGSSAINYGPNITITPSSIGAVSISNQESITGNKTFSGDLTITGQLKYDRGSIAAGKVLTSDASGNASWADTKITGITGISLGGTVYTTPTVTITPASISAVSLSGNHTLTGNNTFEGNTTLGDTAQDQVIIRGSLKYDPGLNGSGAGKVLTSDANGNASWLPPTPTGITSITMGTTTESTSNVSVTADKINAVSLGTTQTITGDKTFSGHTTLGDHYTDTVKIHGSLSYLPIGQTAPTNGMVLMANGNTGSMSWQIPDLTAAAVTSFNGATGVVVVDIPTVNGVISQIPKASTDVYGTVKLDPSGGLQINNDLIRINPEFGTIPIASTTTLGGIRIGSGLTINPANGEVTVTPATGTAVNSFNTRFGAVTPGNSDYTATPSSVNSVINAVDTVTTQDITATKTFKSLQIITSDSIPSVGSTGKVGIQLDTTGQIKAQRSSADAKIFSGYNPGGVETSFIDGWGNVSFSGTVTAGFGFITTAGVTLGDTTADSIVLNGTVRIPPNAVVGHLLTCTAGSVANAVFTGSISSTNLTVTAVTSGSIQVGMTVTGTGIAALTKINSQTSGSSGSTGVYVVNKVQTVASTTITGASGSAGTAQWAAPPNAPVTSVNSLTGDVKITTTNILNSAGTAADPVVTVANTQDITGSKTFTGSATSFHNNVTIGSDTQDTLLIRALPKIPNNAADGKILVCSNVDGSAGWQTKDMVLSVNSITPTSGNVNITVDNIRNSSGVAEPVVTIGTQQNITGYKTFMSGLVVNGNLYGYGDVTIGNASSDILTINSLPKLPLNAAVGNILVCSNVDGSAGWQAKTLVLSVNGSTPDASGNATVTLGGLLAAGTGTANTFSQAQTFNNTATFTGSTTLGATSSNVCLIPSTLKYTGASRSPGQYLTCSHADGTATWSTLPTFVSTINGSPPTSGNFVINTTTLGAVDITTPQTIGGNKTFSGNSVFEGNTTIGNAGADLLTINSQFKLLNAGHQANRILTCDANGVGTWTDKTIVSSVNNISPVNGNVTITLGNLSAASTTAPNTFSGLQTFSNNVSINGSVTTIGDATSDKVIVNSTLRLPSGSPALGKYLTCTINTAGNEGTVGWSTLPTFISTINSQSPTTNGNFNITTGTLGAVDITTPQTIGGNKTFSGNSTFTGPVVCNGNVNLGNGAEDIITLTGVLAGSAFGTGGANKVLTSSGENGTISLQNPLVSRVRGANNLTAGGLNDVVLGPTDIGSPSNTQFDTLSSTVSTVSGVANSALTAASAAQNTANTAVTNAATAQTRADLGVTNAASAQSTANTAITNASSAQSTANTAITNASAASTAAAGALNAANSKLSSVLTTLTSVQLTVGTQNFSTLGGNGTTGNELHVLRAPPIGIAGGDLEGSDYPNPVLKPKAVQFSKIQDISALKILGGPTTGSAAGPMREIGLGSGLEFENGLLKCNIVGSSTLLQGGTSDNRQTWSGFNLFSNSTNFGSTITAVGQISGGGLGIAGPASITGTSGTLNVTGATTLSSTLGVSGATTLSSTLGVSGATTLSSTLGVSGITSITNTTTSTSSTSGALVVYGGAGIGGTTNIGGALSVTGNITGTLYTGNQPNITSVGTLTAGSIPASLITGVLPVANGGTGRSSYPQCVMTHVSTGFTYTSTAISTAVIANVFGLTSKIAALDTTITPRTNTSKIRVTMTIDIECAHDGVFRLYRRIGATNTEIGGNTQPTPSNRYTGHRSAQYDGDNFASTMTTVNIDYLDSPDTTSAVTYFVVFYSAGGSTVYLNRTVSDSDSYSFERTTSQCILQEFFN